MVALLHEVQILPALFDLDTDRSGIAELLIDWCIDTDSLLYKNEVVSLGWMMDGAEDVDDEWYLLMALAMGDTMGWSADRDRQITLFYVLQWLEYYGREEVANRLRDPALIGEGRHTLWSVTEGQPRTAV